MQPCNAASTISTARDASLQLSPTVVEPVSNLSGAGEVISLPVTGGLGRNMALNRSERTIYVGVDGASGIMTIIATGLLIGMGVVSFAHERYTL